MCTVSCSVDKSKTTVSLCTVAPISLPQFCLRGEGYCTQSKQLSVKVLYIIMLVNKRTNLNALKWIYITRTSPHFLHVHTFCFHAFSTSL